MMARVAAATALQAKVFPLTLDRATAASQIGFG
jgi:hypothetical protein